MASRRKNGDKKINRANHNKLIRSSVDMGRYKMNKVDELTLEYLNNGDRISVLRQKYNDDIITGREINELVNLYRANKQLKKQIQRLLDRG